MTSVDCRARYNQLMGRKTAAESRKAQRALSFEVSNKRMNTLDLTQALVQKVAQETQSQLKYHLEDIVNALLKTCFDESFAFTIDFELKRGRTEANLLLLKDGFEVAPKGGIADIISLGMRVATWSIGNTRNVLCLDESLKWLSADLQPMAAQTLSEITKKLGLQVILVTHLPSIIERGDNIYKITQQNGRSIATLG